MPPTTPGTLGTGSVAYAFAGGADGQAPVGNLAPDGKGNFYGATFSGGTGGFGTLFELSPPATSSGSWTKTTLYSFGGVTDGAYPRGGLIACGKMVCGTTNGQFGVAGAVGSVFSLAKPTKSNPLWQLTTLYSFDGGSDGGAPYGSLLRNKAGVLFGTASGYLGGTGNAYSLTPPAIKGGAWTHAVLHDFPFGSDGYTPLGGVVADAKGMLYGTTVGGGANNAGTVYRLIPPAAGQTGWTEDVLASFPVGTAPEGAPAFGPGGLLYVTASGGGANGYGSILALTRSKTGAAPWAFSVVHDFAGGADGENPAAGFSVIKGALYGTTGGNDTAGTVFVITK